MRIRYDKTDHAEVELWLEESPKMFLIFVVKDKAMGLTRALKLYDSTHAEALFNSFQEGLKLDPQYLEIHPVDAQMLYRVRHVITGEESMLYTWEEAHSIVALAAAGLLRGSFLV